MPRGRPKREASRSPRLRVVPQPVAVDPDALDLTLDWDTIVAEATTLSPAEVEALDRTVRDLAATELPIPSFSDDELDRLYDDPDSLVFGWREWEVGRK